MNLCTTFMKSLQSGPCCDQPHSMPNMVKLQGDTLLKCCPECILNESRNIAIQGFFLSIAALLRHLLLRYWYLLPWTVRPLPVYSFPGMYLTYSQANLLNFIILHISDLPLLHFPKKFTITKYPAIIYVTPKCFQKLKVVRFHEFFAFTD